MRRMSFALTQQQVLDQTKTVTRRMGWTNLKPGDHIQPVVKCMGLKKGEKQQLLGGPIEVVSVKVEPLSSIAKYEDDVVKEGFPEMGVFEFIEFFCKANNCATIHDTITRIEFKYL